MFNFSRSWIYYANIVNWKTDGDHQPKSDAKSDPPLTLWESQLLTVNVTERMFFLSVCCVVTVLAIIGNILTLYAILVRQQRLMFKVCLLSLALSDLLFVSASGTNYISKLSREKSTLWVRNSMSLSVELFTFLMLQAAMNRVWK